MSDQNRPKSELVSELIALRRRVAGLEASEREREREEKALRAAQSDEQKRLREKPTLPEALSIVTSTLDLPSVLTHVAEQICIAIDASSAYISAFNPDTSKSSVLAEHVSPEACPEERMSDLGHTYEEVDSKSMTAMQANRHHIDHVDDPDLPEVDRAWMLQYGIQSVLYLPLWIRKRVIGYAEVCESRRRRVFTPEEIARCQSVAQNATIAIENARLFDESERRRRQSEFLRTASQAVASTLELPQVLTRIAQQMCVAIDATSAYIARYDDETKTSTTLAEFLGPEASPEERVSDIGLVYAEADEEFLGAMRANRPWIAHADDRHLPDIDRSYMLQYAVRSILYVPLWIRERVLGYAEVWESRQRREFTADEIAVCWGIAHSAAIAIENARLYDTAQQQILERKRAEEDLKRYSQRLEEMVEERTAELSAANEQLLKEVTERKRAQETIKRLAYYDALTGLANRTLFNDRLSLALAQARRSRKKLAVMLLDLDDFKEVNDTLGHPVGDELLRAIGERLSTILREGDTICRMGGDEFLLLLPEITRPEETDKIGHKILVALREPVVLDGHELHVTTSLGIAIYPDDGEDADSLVRNADIAMYGAKAEGRDNYQRYTPS